MVCCQSGGFIASGSPNPLAHPAVFLPQGILPSRDEGFGEGTANIGNTRRIVISPVFRSPNSSASPSRDHAFSLHRETNLCSSSKGRRDLGTVRSLRPDRRYGESPQGTPQSSHISRRRILLLLKQCGFWFTTRKFAEKHGADPRRLVESSGESPRMTKLGPAQRLEFRTTVSDQHLPDPSNT